MMSTPDLFLLYDVAIPISHVMLPNLKILVPNLGPNLNPRSGQALCVNSLWSVQTCVEFKWL